MKSKRKISAKRRQGGRGGRAPRRHKQPAARGLAPSNMQSAHKKEIAVIVAALVILGVIFALGARYAAPGGEVGFKVERAPDGEYVPTLPREFILDEAARPKASEIIKIGDREVLSAENYSVDYGADGRQLTARYESQKSLEELVALHEQFLSENGWAIINRTVYPLSVGLYARKGINDLSVSVSDKGSAREVSVNYLET